MADIFSNYKNDEDVYVIYSDVIALEGMPMLAQRWCCNGVLGESLVLCVYMLADCSLTQVLQLAAKHKHAKDARAMSLSFRGDYVVLDFNLQKIAEKLPCRAPLSCPVSGTA